VDPVVKAHRAVKRRSYHIFLDCGLRDGGEVVSLTRLPHFTSGRFVVRISVRS
jgi:hypothetical protein